jgi:hypothetical protein
MVLRCGPLQDLHSLKAKAGETSRAWRPSSACWRSPGAADAGSARSRACSRWGAVVSDSPRPAAQHLPPAARRARGNPHRYAQWAHQARIS